jgi:hypothetical protein
LPFDSTGLVF